MKKINKVIMVGIFLGMFSLKANAFIGTTLIVAGELIVSEVVSVITTSEALMAGNTIATISTASAAVLSQGMRRGIVSILKGASNYRKTAIENTIVKKGGWVKDPYDSKHYRIKDMEADHIWPKSLGGTNHSVNLVMTSKHNNRSKGNRIDLRVIKGYLHKLLSW